MKYLLCLFYIGALSGCMTSQELEQMQYDDAYKKCQRYGFKPNTNPFASCMQKEMNPQNAYSSGQNPMDAYNNSLCTTGYKEHCK